MLSYRHAFHAGNFADVLKHSVLCWILQAMQQKDKPFVYFDTHSGAGRYDLESAQAAKNREYESGIGRFWEADDAPGFFRAYLKLVHAYNPDGDLRYYPGSPGFARQLLRAQDRMVLMDLHTREVPVLEALFARDRQVKVYLEDGFQGLIARLPPKERRGVVLIDPSYEVKEDYKKVVNVVMEAQRIFATGVYCVWYPVIDRAQVEALTRAFLRSGMRRILRMELCIAEDCEGSGMTGSGMFVVNPPWLLDKALRQDLPWVVSRLSTKGFCSAEWVVPE